MAQGNYTIRIDAQDRLSPWVQSLLAELPKRSAKFVGAALCRFERLAQTRCFHTKRLGTGRAGELRIALEPSKAFCKFVLAVRTGDIDAL
jgi:hypothetical protein